MKHIEPSRINKCARLSFPASGSILGVTLKTLIDNAKKTPLYWLTYLDIEHGERLVKLKDQLKRTAHYNTERQLLLGGQILATRECMREVKRVMAECEKMLPAKAKDV